MNIVVLNDLQAEIRNLFRDFVPIEFRPLMEEGRSFMIGAVQPDPEGLEAAGVTLVALEDEEFVIKWMWVDPDLTNREAGSKMMDALFRTANENGLKSVIIQVPSLKNEKGSDKEMLAFFFEFAFGDAEIKTVDGIRVIELSADVDEYLSIENNLANEDVAQARIEKGYEKFPKEYTVTGVEFFSGVVTE
ncbi:MAG: hypothetical protein IKO32_11375 [Lachnospiraceae bacterium]|nr:hypothetical protein [Lachnospiraceae bacterium]